MKAYYNEHDPKTAAWLRELIKANLIAPGDVDERSIEDVLPRELAGYTQCHFFAGIGTWSYALRRAGWPDDRPVWTGSCPCQPFSQAGKGKGFADERHLWPAWFHLIGQCRPDVVFGEQVESKNGRTWLDLVQSDLEASAYAFGSVGLCAAGLGAPHIRPRLFFVADTTGQRYDGRRAGQTSGRSGESQRSRDARKLGNATLDGSGTLNGQFEESRRQKESLGGSSVFGQVGTPGPIGGFWADAEWLYCRDEKYRAVEPGTFPLADGAAERVGRLRGYGNAIVAPVAEEFIRAYLESKTS